MVADLDRRYTVSSRFRERSHRTRASATSKGGIVALLALLAALFLTYVLFKEMVDQVS